MTDSPTDKFSAGEQGNPKTQADAKKCRHTDSKPLESWKAIANYLNRSVRTVRRWEATEQLPVHRHQHKKGSSVYAYSSELDMWRARQCEAVQQRPTQSATAEIFAPFAATLRYAAMALIVGLIGFQVGKSGLKSPAIENSTTANNATWVLVESPETDDGLQELGENLRATLDREISLTGSHYVVPEQRIQSILQLMRLDPNTPLSHAIAREIALRDGGISVLLTPRVEQRGDSYMLSVDISDPYSGLLVFYHNDKVGDSDPMPPAVEKLAQNVKTGLLTLPVKSPIERLARVTTSSISALGLYSQSSKLLNNDRPTAANEFLNLAIEVDSEFASALALKAWALRQGGSHLESYRPISKAAAELMSSISAPERYFIEGSYRHFSGDMIRANANYRALLELQPDHVFGAKAMLELCIESRRMAKCTEEKVRLAELKPGHFESNLQAAWSLAANESNTTRAGFYADRSLKLLEEGTEGTERFSPNSAARALVFPMITAWTSGNSREALKLGKQLREDLPTFPVTTRNLIIKQLVAFSIATGQIEEARTLLKLTYDPEQRYELQASILFALGDMGELKRYFASGGYHESPLTALLLSMSGFAEQVTAFDVAPLPFNEMSNAVKMSNAQLTVIRAIKASGDGQSESAIALLRSAVATLIPEDEGYYFIGPELLSDMLKAKGNLAEALSVLEKTAPQRFAAAYNSAGLFWINCQRHLAALYREVGRDQDAAHVEDGMRRMLISSDQDFDAMNKI